MSDQEAIQGLWRLVSYTHGGRPVGTSATHYLFSGNKQKKIVPSMVDTGKVRAVFELNEEADPKEIVVTMDWNGPDGPPSDNPKVYCAFYRLSGDDLQFCQGGVFGQFPETFSDQTGLMTLKRDYGPIPETRKPSGTPPVEDNVLGRLIWDDNLNWYSGKLSRGNESLTISLQAEPGDLTGNVFNRARQVVGKLEHYIALAKELSAAHLLDLANDWAEDQGPVTAADFKARISLESLVFGPEGDVAFYHNDGDLFWGHCVQLEIDKGDGFVHADIPG